MIARNIWAMRMPKMKVFSSKREVFISKMKVFVALIQAGGVSLIRAMFAQGIVRTRDFPTERRMLLHGRGKMSLCGQETSEGARNL